MIELQDIDRAITDLQEAARDPRNAWCKESIEHSILLIQMERSWVSRSDSRKIKSDPGSYEIGSMVRLFDRWISKNG